MENSQIDPYKYFEPLELKEVLNKEVFIQRLAKSIVEPKEGFSFYINGTLQKADFGKYLKIISNKGFLYFQETDIEFIGKENDTPTIFLK